METPLNWVNLKLTHKNVRKKDVDNTVITKAGTGGQTWRRLKRVAMIILKTYCPKGGFPLSRFSFYVRNAPKTSCLNKLEAVYESSHVRTYKLKLAQFLFNF